jgi:amino-acid N-acetyltransferase
MQLSTQFVTWFRQSSPYIHTHRGTTCVILFSGEAIVDTQFPNFIHDLALLHSLGLKLVLVYGARPQVLDCIKHNQLESQYHNNLRITDKPTLECVKQAVGAIRLEIEALLSAGVASLPSPHNQLKIVSSNFITAQPRGIVEGIDYHHTGVVRRVNTDAIKQQLDAGNIVLIPPLGYSPTAEIFNLSSRDVATATACALKADKLLILMEPNTPDDIAKDYIHSQLTPSKATQQTCYTELPEEFRNYLSTAAAACQSGVKRTHLIDRQVDGALLLELFTRDGVGTMVTEESYDQIRQATIEDANGIIELITPLEQQGILVRRSRERLELEISYFTVLQRDGLIIACAALYPYPQHGMAELACLAVHPDYRNQGRADNLLQKIEQQALLQGIQQLFVLTTQTAHWFLERGFNAVSLDELPSERRNLYNYQRNSSVFLKVLK